MANANIKEAVIALFYRGSLMKSRKQKMQFQKHALFFSAALRRMKGTKETKDTIPEKYGRPRNQKDTYNEISDTKIAIPYRGSLMKLKETKDAFSVAQLACFPSRRGA